MRYMLDTNICIYAIKHKPEQVFIRLKEHDPQELCISSVTYAELVHGVEKSKATEKNRVALALLLANIDIVSFDLWLHRVMERLEQTWKRRELLLDRWI